MLVHTGHVVAENPNHEVEQEDIGPIVDYSFKKLNAKTRLIPKPEDQTETSKILTILDQHHQGF